MSRLAARLRTLVAGAQRPPSPWRGIYSRFDSVPVAGMGFSGADWVEASVRAVEELAGGAATLAPRDGGLLACAVTSLQPRGTALRVLDFGGGAGIDFVHLTRVCPRLPALDYVVVEDAGICAAARRLHAAEPRLSFVDDLAAARGPFDIVHMSAALQYVDPWREVLTTLCAHAPQRLFISNSFVGDFSTFATGQVNHPGSTIPCWFFSRAEIVGHCRSLGYVNVVDVATGNHYDQARLPAGRRPGRARNLLFTVEPSP